MAPPTQKRGIPWSLPFFRGPQEPPPPRQPDAGPQPPSASRPEGWRWPPLTFTRSELPEFTPEDAYAYGHYDGATGSTPQNYKRYLYWTLEEQRLQGLYDEARARTAETERRMQFVRDLPSALAATTEERFQRERQLESAGETLDDLTRRIDGLEAEQKEQRYRGSLLSAVMYLAVAVSFVLAEVVVAQRIVADSLRLNGTLTLGRVRLDESWLFAVGLAMVSVLLKPAYDRLVEEKYWNGTGMRRFTWVMLAVSGFALVTLFVLGAFRAEGFQTQAELSQLRAQGLPASEFQRQAANLAKRELESPLGQWAIVLSGLLFAISGAVCLSIGTRHTQDFYHLRLKLGSRRRELLLERASTTAARDRLRADIARVSQELSRMMVAYSESPELPVLEAAVLSERSARDESWIRLQDAKRNKLMYVYSDGYSRGVIGDPEPHDLHQRRPLEAIRRALRLNALRGIIRAEDVQVP